MDNFTVTTLPRSQKSATAWQDGNRTWSVRRSPQPEFGLTPEAEFLQTLRLERKRAERSGKHFLLMLLEGDATVGRALLSIAESLESCTRETDLSGWYRQGSALGAIYTDVELAQASSAEEALRERIDTTLRAHLRPGQTELCRVSFHLFPEASDPGGWICGKNSALYADVRKRKASRQLPHLIKRLVDIVGSAAALLIFAPLFALIAAAIKLTSKGPILYRQERVGQYGRRFTFLKFRSMHVNNNPAIHRQYVKDLIKGNGAGQAAQGTAAAPVYKITRDPRVTPFGSWLRKTSLDELPQLVNVLMGDMSLVGPRPPIPYELDEYDAWHRRRLLEVQPGVTGLWQVSGRSSTTFDEMVRLDLRYARQWSLWLDLRILARTPAAVFSGTGAY